MQLAAFLAYSVVIAPSAPAIHANIAAARSGSPLRTGVEIAERLDEAFPRERAVSELLHDVELSALTVQGPVSITPSSESLVSVSIAALDTVPGPAAESLHLRRHLYVPSDGGWVRVARLEIDVVLDAGSLSADAALRFERASPIGGLSGWTLHEAVRSELGGNLYNLAPAIAAGSTHAYLPLLEESLKGAHRELTVLDAGGRVAAHSAGATTWGEVLSSLRGGSAIFSESDGTFDGFWACFLACVAEMGLILAEEALACLIDGFLLCLAMGAGPWCYSAAVWLCEVEIGAGAVVAVIACALACL
jgi:hypothetical protein